jgi:hypothetical protein
MPRRTFFGKPSRLPPKGNILPREIWKPIPRAPRSWILRAKRRDAEWPERKLRKHVAAWKRAWNFVPTLASIDERRASVFAAFGRGRDGSDSDSDSDAERSPSVSDADFGGSESESEDRAARHSSPSPSPPSPGFFRREQEEAAQAREREESARRRRSPSPLPVPSLPPIPPSLASPDVANRGMRLRFGTVL